MAYIDNYSNGYKSGYSSSDDPERKDYSPSGVEAQRRNALAESYERERRRSKYQAGLDGEQRERERREAEREREEWKMSQIEREGREQVAERRKAINLIVQQKRDEYNKKSWFGKAIATLRGKSFDKMKRQITEAAERRVDRMSPEQIEQFIERQTEGRSR